jgi:hypothetical protein
VTDASREEVGQGAVSEPFTGGRGAGEAAEGDAAPTLSPPSYGLRDDYPELWSRAHVSDFTSLIGTRAEPVEREIEAAMRELWFARRRIVRERRPLRGKHAPRGLEPCPDCDGLGFLELEAS